MNLARLVPPSWRWPLLLVPVFFTLYGLNWRTTLVGDTQSHLFQAASLLGSGDYTLDEYAPLLLALCTIPTWILYGKLNGWFGGWCWGYRYLMDILPELIVLFALGARVVGSRRPARFVLGAAVSLAIMVQAVGALGFDHQWHGLHDLGVGPSQRWLWQVRNSQILFTLKRGRVYLGARPVSLWKNPYRSEGLYTPENWNGTPAVWTGARARFLHIARDWPTTFWLAPSPAATPSRPVQVQVQVDGAPAAEVMFSGPALKTVTLPTIPFQSSAMIEILVSRTYAEAPPPAGRTLGVALPLSAVTRITD